MNRIAKPVHSRIARSSILGLTSNRIQITVTSACVEVTDDDFSRSICESWHRVAGEGVAGEGVAAVDLLTSPARAGGADETREQRNHRNDLIAPVLCDVVGVRYTGYARLKSEVPSDMVRCETGVLRKPCLPRHTERKWKLCKRQRRKKEHYHERDFGDMRTRRPF